ncbi:methyltransferase family protein [Promicromonospora sukumoe]|uniref:methyltransferase family protein n=1 Tax=Promicromonospora sukumoe TaxID=88382 RepID=UPI003651540A
MTGLLDPATAAVVVRGAAVGLPVLAVVVQCALRPPGPRTLAAAITATAWAALLLLLLNVAAPGLGWWTFHATGAVWLGVPTDLWLGWSLLWGAVPALALASPAQASLSAPPAQASLSAGHSPLRPPGEGRMSSTQRGGGGRGGVVLVGAGLVWIDLALMPLGEPVVVLGEAWLVGEAVGVATALVPALLLARWTLRGTHVVARAWGQAVWAGGLLLVVPVAALAPEPRWPTALTSLGLQLTLLLCLPGLAAMRELADVGCGTPLPYDPPARLVTSGPYAYLRNPMQATIAAAYATLALTFGEPALLVGTLIAIVYSAGLGEWHEGRQLRQAFGAPYLAYRAAVRPWLPRRRPAPVAPVATLWVAGDCEQCRGVAAWFGRRSPVRLDLRPAADHPEILYRVTYEAPGVRAQGIAAIARALGHVHLGWALAGWALGLPGVRHFAQLCTDAFGADPRPSRPETCPTAPTDAVSTTCQTPRSLGGPERLTREPVTPDI